MMIVILEDDSDRISLFKKKHPTAEYFVSALKLVDWLEKYSGEIELLFLDHDLDGKQMVSTEEEDCGSVVARYLSDHFDRFSPRIKTIVLHSLNEEARNYMELCLTGYHVKNVPWNILKLEYLKKFSRILET